MNKRVDTFPRPSIKTEFFWMWYTLRIIELPLRAATYKEMLAKGKSWDVSAEWRSSPIFRSMILIVKYQR